MGVVFGFKATPPLKNIVVLGASYGGVYEPAPHSLVLPAQKRV
jgi:hypothetical protein